MEEWFGWIGNIFYIWGAIQLARVKPINSLIHNIIGGICYTIVGHITNLNSLIAISILLIVINVIGIFRWRKMKSGE